MRFPLPGDSEGLMAFTVALIAGLSVPQFTVAQSQSRPSSPCVQELGHGAHAHRPGRGPAVPVTQMQEPMSKTGGRQRVPASSSWKAVLEKLVRRPKTGGVTPGASPQAQTGENDGTGRTLRKEGWLGRHRRPMSARPPMPDAAGRSRRAGPVAGPTVSAAAEGTRRVAGRRQQPSAGPDAELEPAPSRTAIRGAVKDRLRCDHRAATISWPRTSSGSSSRFIQRRAGGEAATNWLGEALLQRSL